MRRNGAGLVLLGGLPLGLALAAGAVTSGQKTENWPGVLDEHPEIQYASRPTSDRVAALNKALAQNQRTLRGDPLTGALRSVLDALGVRKESQLLVFSK